MRAAIIINGAKIWTRNLERAGVAVKESAPFLQEVALDIERIENAVFESQGRRGGGSWKALSPETIRTKANKRLDPRINIATGHLLFSVTEERSPYAVREITNHSLRFGTTAPGAKQSSKFRPFFKFTKYDRRRWAKMWGQYVVRFIRV